LTNLAINQGTAKGALYIDDGDTYAFEHGAFAHTEFKYTNNTFSCVSLHEDPTGTDATDFAQSHQVLTIERIRIVGLKMQPTHARLYAPNIRPYKDLPFDYDKTNGVLSVGKPNVSVIDCRWSIVVV
jgi:alpha 1,3-glucosidase